MRAFGTTVQRLSEFSFILIIKGGYGRAVKWGVQEVRELMGGKAQIPS